jgi:hypothetical protein
VSYTELEFEAATEASLNRLVFLLDTEAADVGIPLSRLIDAEFGARQEAFRRRVRDSGLATATFTNPATLGQLMERSLRELAERHRRAGGVQGRPVPATVVAGEIPQEPLGFQPRADLLAALEAPGLRPRVRGRVHVRRIWRWAQASSPWPGWSPDSPKISGVRDRRVGRQ